jgi:hypothetical protein
MFAGSIFDIGMMKLNEMVRWSDRWLVYVLWVVPLIFCRYWLAQRILMADPLAVMAPALVFPCSFSFLLPLG